MSTHSFSTRINGSIDYFGLIFLEFSGSTFLLFYAFNPYSNSISLGYFYWIFYVMYKREFLSIY